VGAACESNGRFPTVLSSTQVLLFVPQRRTLNLADIFIQDSISLTGTLKLILGMKLEHDPYTALEPLPKRVSHGGFGYQSAVGGRIRAVRAPSDLTAICSKSSAGGIHQRRRLSSRKLTAYELGYRTQPSANSSISISTFYNVYTEPSKRRALAERRLPAVFANGMAGNTYGVEVWGNYQLSAWWRLAAGANWLHKNLHFEPAAAASAAYRSPETTPPTKPRSVRR